MNLNLSFRYLKFEIRLFFVKRKAAMTQRLKRKVNTRKLTTEHTKITKNCGEIKYV